MMSTRPTASSGLSTDQHKVKEAGVYSIYSRSTVVPASGLVVTMSQSGSTTASFTSPTTSEKQIDVEMNAKFNCAVDDILTVAITSSAPADQPPQLIKTIINLRQGV